MVNPAIPVMVELIWKKGDLQYGALPELLAEGKVERALPVLVRSKQGVPRVMGRFGETATEHILEAFPAAQREHRFWLIEALGFTGGSNAVVKLIDLLKSETESFGREAATALGNLGQYAFLRDEYSRVKPVEVRLAMLQGLAKDKGAETRQHLLAVATTATRLNHSPSGDERLTAFQASWSIYALGRNPVPGATTRLTELLSNTNSECRASAAIALGNIGGEAALKSLEQAELKEKEEAVRRMIRSEIQTAKDAERIKRQVSSCAKIRVQLCPSVVKLSPQLWNPKRSSVW